MICCDDKPSGVWHLFAHFGQPAIRSGKYSGNPIALRVKRRAPGLGRHVFRVTLAETRLHLVAHAGAPAHLARVRHEQHGPHDTVSERSTVSVAVIGQRRADALIVRRITHERDRRAVAAKRSTREREPARCALERLSNRVAPTERVSAVVNLVEDHERAPRLGDRLVQARLDSHLRVGHSESMKSTTAERVAVSVLGIQPDANPVSRVSPLPLEVLGRCDHRDAVDDAPSDEFGCQAKCEGCLASARSRRREKVARLCLKVRVECLGLPRA